MARFNSALINAQLGAQAGIPTATTVIQAAAAYPRLAERYKQVAASLRASGNRVHPSRIANTLRRYMQQYLDVGAP